MSLNFVGGTAGVLALVGVLYLHGCQRTVTSPNVSERVHAPEIVVVAQPDIKPAKEPAKPAPQAAKPIAPAAQKPIPQAAKQAVVHPAKKPVYHRVLKGGTVDGPMDCKQVPAIAKQYPPDKVLKIAKQYGLTEAQISELRVCLN